jgi:hypothetical protein
MSQGIWQTMASDDALTIGTGRLLTNTCVGGVPTSVGRGNASATIGDAGPRFNPVKRRCEPGLTTPGAGCLLNSFPAPRGFITGGGSICAINTAGAPTSHRSFFSMTINR